MEEIYDLETYNYHLPKELIAQEPLENREDSKLLILHRKSGRIEHSLFKEIIKYLEPGDCLVINTTKVLPCRISGEKIKTGGKVEVLLLQKIGKNIYSCLAKPRIKEGIEVSFGEILKGKFIKCESSGIKTIEFYPEKNLEEKIQKLGKLPLPPYIKKELKDKNRYQTVYAKIPGSAAAPTAGLHFTEELLEKIKRKGIKIVEVILHISIDTFKPVKEKDIRKHIMYSEYYEIPKTTAEIINKTKLQKKRIIAVGTTTVRVLETQKFPLSEKKGWTSLFIYPGFEFKIVDALITNFHFPKSTLLMLVSAFAGKELIKKSYQEAIDKKYRFYSFGDAMLIL
jgi:S-adenosylmethionine:tRNA ribosyltransferase-isomerase